MANTEYVTAGPWTVKPKTWTTLLTIPGTRHAIFGAYLRLGSESGFQIITRFIRDPYDEADYTGSEDRMATPGKDYITRMWMFTPVSGAPVGIQIWHDNPSSIVVEYGQLKSTVLT
jgi:hypothetical protein